MTGHPIPNVRNSPRIPPFSGRTLAMFCVIVSLWGVAAAWGIDWAIQERTAALVTQEAAHARGDVHRISENLERVLNRLQGLPAVLAGGPDFTGALESFGPGIAPSRIPLPARQAAWTERRDLLALGERLVNVAHEMDVDVIWLMNAAGDCVASSNFGDQTTFVGTNYADRSYFRVARDGQRGRQYAMGRVTNVPGLFFSAPVAPGGRFLGTVAIKIDLPRLAPWLNHPHAYGHSGGDEALRHFVNVARRELRGEDILGRLGGEEFGMLLPETEVMNALSVAERVRRAVEAAPARFGEALIPISASFGIARWKSTAESPGALMQRADIALYQAKAAGRNRVVVAGDAPETREGSGVMRQAS